MVIQNLELTNKLYKRKEKKFKYLIILFLQNKLIN